MAQASVSQIRAACDLASELIRPATAEHILAKVELLLNRGFQSSKPQQIEKALYSEWLEDLMDYPADLINLACKNWRNGNNKRAPYGAGELMESVKDEWTKRLSNYAKFRDILLLIQKAKHEKQVATPEERNLVKIPKMKGTYRDQSQKCRPVNEQLKALLGGKDA